MVKPLAASATLMALVAACAMGGAQRPAMQPQSEASPAGTAPAALPESPQDELERLWQQIETERQTLGLADAPAPMPGPAQPMTSVPLAANDPTCRPAPTDRCTQSCQFSDSICTNAARICKLAESMPGSTSASDKCGRAKSTCESAHTTCCSCQ